MNSLSIQDRLKEAIEQCKVLGAPVEQLAPVIELHKLLNEKLTALSASVIAKHPAELASNTSKGFGPGTELARIFGSVGASSCQQCTDLARRMDDWGVAGCKEHRAEIVADIESRSNKVSLQDMVKLGAKLFTSGLPLSIGGLVDEAIRRAEVVR